MASLGNGNSWRQRGQGWDPIERGDVSAEGSILDDEVGSGPVAAHGANEFTDAREDGPRPLACSSLCRSCYCDHSPACPPCDCAFHNPNVL